MVVNVTDIFRISTGYGASNPAALFQKKEAVPRSGEDAKAGSRLDQVVLSPLAKALKQTESPSTVTGGGTAGPAGPKGLEHLLSGDTAKIFGSLDQKDQAELQELYAKGSVTAEDVQLGLQYMANQSIFMRAWSEEPFTDAEKAQSAEAKRISDLQRELRNEIIGQMQSVADIAAQHDRGEITSEEMSEHVAGYRRQREAFEQENAEILNQDATAMAMEAANARLGRAVAKMGGPATTPEQKQAVDKLFQAGFRPEGVAPFTAFAKSQDKPQFLR